MNGSATDSESDSLFGDDSSFEIEMDHSPEGLSATTRSRARRSRVEQSDLDNEAFDLDDDTSDEDYVPKKKKSHRKKKKKFVLGPSTKVHKRDEINQETCVVLGREGNKAGIYGRVLSAWWERYEAARHTDKRVVCRAVIQDMLSQGVSFLSKMEDGSRNGKQPELSRTVKRIHRSNALSVPQAIT